MNRFWKALALCGSLLVVTVLAALILVRGIGFGGLLLLLVLGAVYAWVLFAFLHYRQSRQAEFLEVITAAAEAQAPLAPALCAYLLDRPHGRLREFWIALFLFFIVPGYYWIAYRRTNYDRKVEQVAGLLEEGDSLSDALQQTPGVASRETRLAVALGEDTGQLARSLQSLRNSTRGQLASLWVELVPRFVYPLFLLLVISGVLNFWTLYLVPKYQRIFREMSVSLPHETEWVMALGRFTLHWSWVLVLAVPILAGLLILLLLSPEVRWYFPVVGHFYRRYVRSRILQALAFLLQMGEPAPAAFAVLDESGYFTGGARRCLNAVRQRVVRGEPLADSLRQERVVPRSMVPLLKVAERAGNLPWGARRAGRRAGPARGPTRPAPRHGVLPRRDRGSGCAGGRGGDGRVCALDLPHGGPGPMRAFRAPRFTAGHRGFTLTETVLALGIVGGVLLVLAQFGYLALCDRQRNAARQDALEAAANVLESARVVPWEDLTPAWAGRQAPVGGPHPAAARRAIAGARGTRAVTSAYQTTHRGDSLVGR